MALVMALDGRTDPAELAPPGADPGHPVRVITPDGVTVARLFRWPTTRVPGCYAFPILGIAVHGPACALLQQAGPR